MATNDDVLPWRSRSVNCEFRCVLCSYTVYVSPRSSIDSIDLNYVLKKFGQVLLASFAMGVTSAITLFAIKQVMPLVEKYVL